MLLAVPALVTLLCVVAEVGNLWLARTELTNAMEASALAAVKEWGDNGGGDTWGPRNVGNAYAMANTINGDIVDLTRVDDNMFPLNYDPAEQCNQNACNRGVLVFGAIVDDDPEFVFDCCETPSCLAGNVVLDATAQGSLQTGSNHEWGISFQPTASPTMTRIRRVIYILPEECMGIEPRFDFTSAIPEVSSAVTDCHPNILVVDNCPNNIGTSGQADVYGIDRNEVHFYIDIDPMNPIDLNCGLGTGTPVTTSDATYISRILAVEFPDGPNPLLGFDVEDHMRFGASVTDNGSGTVGADQIGMCGVGVIVCFSDGTSVMGTFFDNNQPSHECLKCAQVAPWGSNTILHNNMTNNCPNDNTTLGNHGLIIHPTLIPDIPCPAASGQNNNGQSLAFAGARGSGRAFAVRAQATYQVPSICCELFCVPIGPFHVQAKADALYDCELRQPRLYHLEDRNFHCSVGCP